MVLARKGPLEFSPISSPNPDTGWKPMLHCSSECRERLT